jgi:hypothetical protein
MTVLSKKFLLCTIICEVMSSLKTFIFVICVPLVWSLGFYYKISSNLHSGSSLQNQNLESDQNIYGPFSLIQLKKWLNDGYIDSMLLVSTNPIESASFIPLEYHLSGDSLFASENPRGAAQSLLGSDIRSLGSMITKSKSYLKFSQASFELSKDLQKGGNIVVKGLRKTLETAGNVHPRDLLNNAGIQRSSRVIEAYASKASDAFVRGLNRVGKVGFLEFSDTPRPVFNAETMPEAVPLSAPGPVIAENDRTAIRATVAVPAIANMDKIRTTSTDSSTSTSTSSSAAFDGGSVATATATATATDGPSSSAASAGQLERERSNSVRADTGLSSSAGDTGSSEDEYLNEDTGEGLSSPTAHRMRAQSVSSVGLVASAAASATSALPSLISDDNSRYNNSADSSTVLRQNARQPAESRFSSTVGPSTSSAEAKSSTPPASPSPSSASASSSGFSFLGMGSRRKSRSEATPGDDGEEHLLGLGAALHLPFLLVLRRSPPLLCLPATWRCTRGAV